MYEVVNQRTSHGERLHSEQKYLPQLKHPNPTLLNRNWFKTRPQSGLVSVDFVTPYSVVVRSAAVNVVPVIIEYCHFSTLSVYLMTEIMLSMA